MDRAFGNQTADSSREMHAHETPLGVSVVICTYNGAARLPQTLAHLAAQENTDTIAWEVLVVDNASTDDTAEVARRCWPADAPAPLRIVHEPRLGTAYARRRGLMEAGYEIIGFVDDDNWLAANWLSVMNEIMARDPQLGALGSLSYPACEIEPPRWFERFRADYTIFTEDDLAVVGEAHWGLFSAGMSIRKTAWLQLLRDGFDFSISGAVGSRLGRGEDSELTFALREAGWKLRIEPRLRFEHFIPASRLNWAYLRRLKRESAISTVALDAYNLPSDPGTGMKSRLRKTWGWHALAAARALLKDPRTLVLAPLCAMEGDPAVLAYEGWRGRLTGLLRLRGKYRAAMLKQRRWKVRDPRA
ncbi:MAG TPA: glycosyltransferase [Candidatus Binataceae bacterium]|nr:glycosyltransferase [Candidatus Binataceae bacterium]